MGFDEYYRNISFFPDEHDLMVDNSDFKNIMAERNSLNCSNVLGNCSAKKPIAIEGEKNEGIELNKTIEKERVL